MTEVPLYPEAFVAWRGWLVSNGKLHSVLNDVEWIPGEPVEAVCSKSHNVPFKSCQCGLYGVSTYKKLVKNQYHVIGAFGLVSMWGKMIEGSAGWRSLYAYPKEIYIPHLFWDWYGDLKEYGVPVRLSNPFNMEDKS